MTRRRPQPDFSDDEMRPTDIPQSAGSEVTITEGFENEVTKVVITVPFSLMQETKFEQILNTHILDMGITFSVEKMNEYVTILAKLSIASKKMEVEQD